MQQRGGGSALHGSEQGVVMEGPLRYRGNVIAVKPAAGRKPSRLCKDTSSGHESADTKMCQARAKHLSVDKVINRK